MQTWWLSFCDPDRPEGQQFLGVVVVDVDEMDVARAEPAATAIRAAHGLPPLSDPADQWMSGAIGKTYRLKMNPGGAVAAVRVDDVAPPEELAAVPRDRLLQQAEIAPWTVSLTEMCGGLDELDPRQT
jgi:hypothetical protein